MFQVIDICLCHGIGSKDVMATLLTLTFEGYVSQWFHRLPIASIHSLAQLTKKLHKAFDKYNHQDFYERINHF